MSSLFVGQNLAAASARASCCSTTTARTSLARYGKVDQVLLKQWLNEVIGIYRPYNSLPSQKVPRRSPCPGLGHHTHGFRPWKGRPQTLAALLRYPRATEAANVRLWRPPWQLKSRCKSSFRPPPAPFQVLGVSIACFPCILLRAHAPARSSPGHTGPARCLLLMEPFLQRVPRHEAPDVHGAPLSHAAHARQRLLLVGHRPGGGLGVHGVHEDHVLRAGEVGARGLGVQGEQQDEGLLATRPKRMAPAPESPESC